MRKSSIELGSQVMMPWGTWWKQSSVQWVLLFSRSADEDVEAQQVLKDK